MKSNNRFWFTATLVILLTAHDASAGVVEEMQSLMDKGQSAKAYELGKQKPQMGNPDFDLALGIAALDALKFREGVDLLSQYVAKYPNHSQVPRAQVELGRGYFVLGDFNQSRLWFNKALAGNPPEPVRKNIQDFLDFMDKAPTATAQQRTRIHGFLEAGISPDSNVNAGVSDANVNLPVFGQTTLDSTGVEQSATAGLARGGIGFEHDLAQNLYAFGDAQGDMRLYNVNTEFNQRGITVSGGLGWTTSANLLRASMLYNVVEIDNDPYREVPLLNLDWTRQLDSRSTIGASFQFGELLYDGANELRDATLVGGGIAYRRALELRFQPVINLGFGYTNENNQNSRPDLSRGIWGLRGGVDLTLAPRWTAGANVSWQRSDYQDDDPLLAVEREDDYVALDLSLRYQIMTHLSARAEITLANNDSNLQLYEYDRNTVALIVRYDFN